VVATSDVLNALNDGVGRLARRPLWVGAFAFLLLTAVGAVALMSVAIGVLATLRVAYTTSIDHVSHVASTTDQRLTDRQSRPQTVTPISPVVLPAEALARPTGTTDASGALPRSDLPSSETAQPVVAEAAPPSSQSDEAPARSTLTDLIEAQSPSNAPVIARTEGGDDGHPAGASASPAVPLESGVVAWSASAGEAARAAPPPASAGSPPVPDIALTSGAPETDEIGRLATAPLPAADTAAALSHLRHVLKRRAQARMIKHTVHKPAPRTALQNKNYRPFDPFQPATPPAAGASTRPKTW
jgi:hypothetical protein